MFLNPLILMKFGTCVGPFVKFTCARFHRSGSQVVLEISHIVKIQGIQDKLTKDKNCCLMITFAHPCS